MLFLDRPPVRLAPAEAPAALERAGRFGAGLGEALRQMVHPEFPLHLWRANFSSFALGISGIDWRRFLVFNFIAAFLWAASFVGAGYFCGRAAERMLGELAEKLSVILLGIFIVTVVAVFVTQRVRNRMRRQRAQAAEAASP